MSKPEPKKISVIGLGYVGLPLALLAESKGYQVVGVDKDAEKVDMINRRISPFADQQVREQLQRSSLEASTDFKKIIDSSIVIICVPTPVHENHLPDLGPLEGACRSIAQHLQKGQLVILESTVNPGVSESTVIPLLEDGSGLRCGKDFFLAHCPERINPGDERWKVENIGRVIGAFCAEGLTRARAFYRSIIRGEIKAMANLKEAEAVKVVENSFRDINIAFVNELAMSFAQLGIDVVNVIEGAATKPFSFLAHYPGCGVGGHCIPVDPYYLIEYAKQNGFDHDFLSLARRINQGMPEYTARQVVAGLSQEKIPIDGSKVAVLGLAYKAEVNDCRESPAFALIKALQRYGARVASFDPFVPGRSTAASLEKALAGAQAAVLATAHRQFEKLTPEYLLARRVRVVVDGRNCLPKEDFLKAGLVYRGIGR